MILIRTLKGHQHFIISLISKNETWSQEIFKKYIIIN